MNKEQAISNYEVREAPVSTANLINIDWVLLASLALHSMIPSIVSSLNFIIEYNVI